MQRLDGLDAAFVCLEQEAAPLHVAMTCVFDASAGTDRASFERVRALLEERLHLVPPFRRRLVEMPARFHRPVWVEDPDFDLDAHLHRRTLPPPGGLEALAEFTSDVVSRPLDRSRPLWEMFVVDGLDDGMVAVVTKMHHAAIDGVSGAEVLGNLLDLVPDPVPVTPPDRPWEPESLPSPLTLMRTGVGDLVRQPFAATTALGRAVRSALRLRRHNRQPSTSPPPGPFAAPLMANRAPLTSRRHVGFTAIDLDDVKQIKHEVGATVNDVVLALCAGALRRLLADNASLPQEPLVAAVPVSVRTKEQRGTMGNRLSIMLVDLATTIDHPLDRLRAIASSTSAAKRQDRVFGSETISELAGLTPPALLTAMGGLEANLNVLSRKPLCNVVVSSFPGPSLPLYCAGARMTAAYPMGPLAVGTGLNITVQTYLDTLWFGIVACPDAVPEPWTLPWRLDDALHELMCLLSPPPDVPAGRAREVVRA